MLPVATWEECVACAVHDKPIEQKTPAKLEEALSFMFSGGLWCKENRCRHPLRLCCPIPKKAP